MSSFTDELKYEPTNTLAKRSGLPQYKILAPVRFDIGVKGSDLSITVPAGFITDFASFPWPIRAWFSPSDSRWAKAALIHDCMCREKKYSRALIDIVFLEGMLVLGAGWRSFLFYLGVKWGRLLYYMVYGGSYFKADQE